MENALTPHAPIPPSVSEPAMAARMAYEEAVNSDGTSAAAWQAIADDMHATADAMERAGAMPDFVTCHRDRAIDAAHRATLARRMLEVARTHRVIDMSTLGGAS